MNRVADKLPEGPVVAWYGDDFTGAAAVMEVLTLAGLPSVLFLDIPTPDLLQKFAGYRGIGIAGCARSKSPSWMELNLPSVFTALEQVGAPLTHYKVCSTLDSAPHVGSIGKAVQLAQERLDSRWVPVLVAAPAIHRYQLFGNLFATIDGVGYRLDRHPAMSRHPVTPMAEADVRCHLSQQTDIPIGLVDYLKLTEGCANQALNAQLAAGCRLISLDVIDEKSLTEVGRLMWEHRGEHLLAVGSQGVEYALVAYWRNTGAVNAQSSSLQAASVERIAVVSGSCSPITARQITWAEGHGFEVIRLNVSCAVDERAWAGALETATQDAKRAISCGRDPLVCSARGPDDPAISALMHAVDGADEDFHVINERVGNGLGAILDSIFRETRIRRGVIAGGDTSSCGTKRMHIHALTLLATTVPGAALFRAHSLNAHYEGLEIALKGGQMGSADYFGQIKNGGVAVSL